MSINRFIIWAVLIDSNDCKIYRYYKDSQDLELIKELSHPENKLRDIELTSDKPGRYRARDTGHGTFSQQTDPKEIKFDAFAREIAKELDHGRTKNAYGQLIIITLPHMHGLLFQHLNKHVADLITHRIEKNAFGMTEQELLAFLHKHTGRE